MRRIALLLSLLLCIATLLPADEFVVRVSDKLTLGRFRFQTADGGWIVFFTDHSTLSENIYCHRLSAAGELLTTEAILLSYKETDQTLLDVIPTSDGNFIVIWRELTASDFTWMQKVTPQCQCLWASEGVLLSEYTYASKHCRVLANGNGGVTAVFQDYWINPIYGQSFDSGGNKLWGEAGIALVDMDDMVEMENLLSYPGGGFLLHIRIMSGNTSEYKVLRFSEAGVLVDDESMPALDLFERGYASIIGPANGEYLLYTVDADTLRVNKAGTDGEAVLPQNLECALPHQSFDEIKLLSDGRVAYVVHEERDSTYTVNMLSSSLEALWSADENYPTEGQILIDGCPDGKILLTVEPYTQFFDTTGSKLFTQRKALTNEEYVHWKTMLALPANDRGIFLWYDVRDRRQMIKLQILDTGGSLVHGPTGLVLEERLAGVCVGGFSRGEHQCLSLGDRFVSIWLETRKEAPITEDTHHGKSGIYYQLFDQNMQALLEANGRPLQPRGDNALRLIHCVVGNDNKLYILYEANGNKAFFQAIDYHGNPCFGESGIEISNTSQMIGCVGHVVYLFWTVDGTGYSNRIRGQKYVSCQAQWSPGGELLLDSVPNHRYTLLDFANGFLIISDHYGGYTEEGTTYLKALMFDTYGHIIAAGEEHSIPLSSQEASSQSPLIGAGAMGDGCCLIFRPDDSESQTNYYMQRVDSRGDRLWGENGISFDVGGTVNNVIVRDDVLMFLAQSDAGCNLYRVDTMGNFQAPENGINIIPAAYEPQQVNLAAFSDDSMICAFVNNDVFYSDVYTRRLDAEGRPTDDVPVVLCDARNAQSQPRIALHSGTAFITWMDQRAGRDVVGIWGNTVQSSTPADNPQQTPIRQAQIIGNYPNPFNPTTTIVYHIVTEGPAKLDIYNVRGQYVATLVNEPKSRGKHQAVWNGKDSGGKTVASGVYFVRLSSAGQSSVHKMLLMK